MFDYFNGIFAIKAEALYQDLGLFSKDNYYKYCQRGKLKVVVNGCRGQQAWVEYSSVERCGLAALVEAKLGYNPRDTHEYNPIEAILEIDTAAAEFYAGYKYGDHLTVPLPPQVQVEYTHSASVLNAIDAIVTKRRTLRKRIAGRFSMVAVMEEMNGYVQKLDTRVWKHGLSYDNHRSLEGIYKRYKSEGYAAIIHKNYGNKYALKVTELVEQVLLGIYTMEEKPYQVGALDTYLMFLAGQQRLEVIDEATGELVALNPADYFNEKGEPIIISESTVNRWLKKWENENVSDKKRNSDLFWTVKHRPHHHRHPAEFSLSKLTMDDIAIPFKRPDGTRVWSYQIFETQSTAVVGRAYATDKTTDLLTNALKDFIYLCVRNGWGVPGQIECEQHLANTMTGHEVDGKFEADLLTAGTLFTHVTFCPGGMPRSKRAEGFIKQKKYGFQAKRKGFLRRPFARLEANLLNTDKNPKRYTLKSIIRNEEQDINDYNNALHPDQERFPGKTRWEVLVENINPNLPQPQLPVLAFHIGECNKETLIHNSQWVEVARNRFFLPSPSVMRLLSGTTVQAYYFPGDEVKEVYLYQNGRYICTCTPVERYNEAVIERDDEDKRIRNQQMGYVSSFDKMTRDKLSAIPKLIALPVDEVTEQLAHQPKGVMPINGEFDEPDIEQSREAAKARRKEERKKAALNAEIKKKHLEHLTQIANMAKYD